MGWGHCRPPSLEGVKLERLNRLEPMRYRNCLPLFVISIQHVLGGRIPLVNIGLSLRGEVKERRSRAWFQTVTRLGRKITRRRGEVKERGSRTWFQTVTRLGRKITRRRGETKERGSRTWFQTVTRLGRKIIRRRGEVKGRGSSTGFQTVTRLGRKITRRRGEYQIPNTKNQIPNTRKQAAPAGKPPLAQTRRTNDR